MTNAPLLAIETSTVACSVAVGAGASVALRELHEPGAHASRIMPMIDAALDEAGLELAALAGIAYGHGPGSFTGVRIAVALAQGLAAGIGVRVLGVSSLALLAQRIADERAGARTLVVQDARMGEVYAGWYAADAGGIVRAVHPDALLAPDDVAARGCELAVGGALASMAGLRERLERDGVATNPGIAVPSARDALRLAAAAAADDWTAPERAAAVYLRQRVATPGPA